MSGIYEAAMNYKYEVVIYTRSLSEQQDKSYWQFCKEHKLSGAIITGLKTTDPYFLEIVDSNFLVSSSMRISWESIRAR